MTVVKLYSIFAMKRLVIVLLSVLAGSSCYTQEKISTFRQLRYEEDYSHLKNDTAPGWYQKLKYSPLNKKRNSYVSVGGDIRYQYFNIRNETWGEEPKDQDGFLLARLLTHAHFHLGQHLKAFVQIQSSLENGKYHTSALDENPLEFHQAFIDIPVFTDVEQTLKLRLGRQELLYGSQRIISVREGPNNRQSFDGVKFRFNRKNFEADAFYTLHVDNKKKFLMTG